MMYLISRKKNEIFSQVRVHYCKSWVSFVWLIHVCLYYYFGGRKVSKQGGIKERIRLLLALLFLNESLMNILSMAATSIFTVGSFFGKIKLAATILE